jgi:ribosomal protein S12 methylthiotransferase
MKKLKKLGIISLGCDKNRVDTEKALGFLKDQVVLVNDQSQAEIIIVNTCAFLKTAREEAIEEVLLLEDLKKSGSLEKIILTGCLPQLYKKELYLEFFF